MDRNRVYKLIDGERNYQDRKWGAGRPHEVGAWLTLIDTHLQEAKELWSKNSEDGPALEEVRKIASLAVACMEQHETRPREE